MAVDVITMIAPGPGRSYDQEILALPSGEIDAAWLLLDRAFSVADPATT